MNKKLLLWGLFFIWLGVIWVFSSQPATVSSKISTPIAGKIAGVAKLEEHVAKKGVEENKRPSVIENDKILAQGWFNTIIRKTAHVMIYYVAGFFAMLIMIQYPMRLWRQILFAMLLCLISGVIDEIHQSFVPGRSGQVIDAAIDMAGATMGILTVTLVCYLFRRKKA